MSKLFPWENDLKCEGWVKSAKVSLLNKFKVRENDSLFHNPITNLFRFWNCHDFKHIFFSDFGENLVPWLWHM